MKKIKKLEQAKSQKANLNEWEINRTFYWAYQRTLKSVNETIDFVDVIWNYDVKPIIEHCKEFNIDYITISNSQTIIEDILTLFEEQGCEICLTKVRDPYMIDFRTHEPAILNAFKIIIKK